MAFTVTFKCALKRFFSTLFQDGCHQYAGTSRQSTVSQNQVIEPPNFYTFFSFTINNQSLIK